MVDCVERPHRCQRGMGVVMWFDFSPKASVSPDEQRWVDDSLAWMRESFGEECFGRIQPVLPTEAFFPEEFDGALENVRSVFRTVCRLMTVDRERVTLQIYQDRAQETDRRLRRDIPMYQSETGGAAGFYTRGTGAKSVIALEKSTLTNPTALVATMAHELGHVLLLADGRISEETENMEPLTDLLTVFFGFGIFSANSAFQYSSGAEGWSVQRQGYLSQEMYGYALARWATVRDDTGSEWSKHLSTDVKAYFKQSIKAIRHQPKKK